MLIRIVGLEVWALAASLSLGALVAAPPLTAPAMAQSLLDDDDDDDDDSPCMTSHRMRQFLAGQGYTDIRLNSPIGSNWQARVQKGGTTYLVWVNTCNGTISRRQALGTS